VRVPLANSVDQTDSRNAADRDASLSFVSSRWLTARRFGHCQRLSVRHDSIAGLEAFRQRFHVGTYEVSVGLGRDASVEAVGADRDDEPEQVERGQVAVTPAERLAQGREQGAEVRI
jgi:hypothetical protein